MEESKDSSLNQPSMDEERFMRNGEMLVAHKFEGGIAMKKQFGVVATLGIAFGILNSWVGEAGTLLAVAPLGGPVTILWGCVAGAVFASVLCIGLAELASAMPNAGGPYHYTYVVASPRTRNFWSFFVGWNITVAWWFLISSGPLILATFLSGMVVSTHPDYTPSPWKTWLIYVAIEIFCLTVVIAGNKIMSRVTTVCLYWSLASVTICVITTLVMHRNRGYRDASFVFADFSNESGWSNAGIAFIIGSMLSSFSFAGIDAATHLSEEMPTPEKEVPQAMAGAMVIGLVTSFAFLASVFFCTTDLHAVVNTPTGAPILAIFEQATGSNSAALALTSLLFISNLLTCLAGTLVCGRTTWAFARDSGLPWSRYFSAVDPRSRMPIRATLLSVGLSIAYGAIYIGSSVAFNSIVSSSILLLFTSYAAPQAILAVRGRHHLPKRYFDLGRSGWFFNALAPFLAAFSTVVFCLPPQLPVAVGSMNWLSVIIVGCWILIVAYYFMGKRGIYQGPIIE